MHKSIICGHYDMGTYGKCPADALYLGLAVTQIDIDSIAVVTTF